MVERRESIRHPFYRRVEVIHESGNQSFDLLRGNIGFGGTGGFTPNLIEAGEVVSIRFHFPQRSGEIAQEDVSGKIVWAHKDGNFNAMGLTFSSLTSLNQPLLLSYLQYADQFD